MTQQLSIVDRLRVERVVWHLDQRLYDLPWRRRVEVRREVRDNLRTAASDVGARQAVRNIGSALPDPFTAIAGGIAGLYGPLHGGANVAVVKMLQKIASTDNVPDFLEGVKNGDERLMGAPVLASGQRLYRIPGEGE